jgi:hypothetical protein
MRHTATWLVEKVSTYTVLYARVESLSRNAVPRIQVLIAILNPQTRQLKL